MNSGRTARRVFVLIAPFFAGLILAAVKGLCIVCPRNQWAFAGLLPQILFNQILAVTIFRTLHCIAGPNLSLNKIETIQKTQRKRTFSGRKRIKGTAFGGVLGKHTRVDDPRVPTAGESFVHPSRTPFFAVGHTNGQKAMLPLNCPLGLHSSYVPIGRNPNFHCYPVGCEQIPFESKTWLERHREENAADDQKKCLEYFIVRYLGIYIRQ